MVLNSSHYRLRTAAVLFTGTHLGPIAVHYPGREGIFPTLVGSPSCVRSFDGQSWRLVNTCGGVTKHGHAMVSSHSLQILWLEIWLLLIIVK